jgi:hypothetical protein
MADGPYDLGEVIEIQGVVTDGTGAPQAGRAVILEVYRRAVDVRALNFRDRGRSKQGLVQRTTTTDERGRYLFRWPWHDYYNRFEVAVGRFGEEGFEVVERADLSQRVLRGSPVTVSFILGGASNRPGSLGTTSGGRSSSASSAPRSTETTPPTRTAGAGTPSYSATSFAQRDVQARHGAPDKVDSLDLPYGREVTWWYFEKGRAFRFLEGELSEELTFTPVED